MPSTWEETKGYVVSQISTYSNYYASQFLCGIDLKTPGRVWSDLGNIDSTVTKESKNWVYGIIFALSTHSCQDDKCFMVVSVGIGLCDRKSTALHSNYGYYVRVFFNIIYRIDGFHDIFILNRGAMSMANYMHTFVWHWLLDTQISIGLVMSSYKYEPLPLLQYLISDQSCMFFHIQTWYSVCFKLQVDGSHALLEPTM